MSFFWLSFCVFVAPVVALLLLLVTFTRVKRLTAIDPAMPGKPPRVTVVVSALNEADTIEPALRSLLALDYPGLEVLAIDDRSTDETGAILDRMRAEGDARLRVLHIDKLPAGWLGKNHALHRGAEAATGEYILFTDADVHFGPGALRKAAAYCERERLDHLVVLPEYTATNPLLAAVQALVFVFLFIEHPLWLLRTSRKVHLGCGAFNMVRASAYRSAGGHEPIRLEIVDDILLGKLMKDKGYRQDALLGFDAVRVTWYRDTSEMARGLEKNVFAVFHYSLPAAVVRQLLLLVARYWPMVGLFLTSGIAWWFNLGAIVAAVLAEALILRAMHAPWRSVLWFPVSVAVMVGIMTRAVFLAYRRGGVVWRGTLYSLDELRRAHVA